MERAASNPDAPAFNEKKQPSLFHTFSTSKWVRSNLNICFLELLSTLICSLPRGTRYSWPIWNWLKGSSSRGPQQLLGEPWHGHRASLTIRENFSRLRSSNEQLASHDFVVLLRRFPYRAMIFIRRRRSFRTSIPTVALHTILFK